MKVQKKIVVSALAWLLATGACGGDESEGDGMAGKGGSQGGSGGALNGGRGGASTSGAGGVAAAGGMAATGGAGGSNAMPSGDAAAGNYNNQTTITGATIGGTSSFAQSRKTLTATLTKPSTDFELGAAYAAKLHTAAQIIVEVTNKSQKFHCFVEADVVRLKDASGGTLGDEDGTYLTGSLGMSTTSWTDSCLGPGEKGYLLALKADLTASKDFYTPARSVELELSAETYDLQRPDVRIVGEGYTVGERDILERQAVTITVKNEGKQTIKIKDVGSYSTVLGLDAGGTPVGWGYASEGVSNEIVATGQTTRLQSKLSFEGAAAKLLVFVDADGPESRFLITRPELGEVEDPLSEARAAQARWRAAKEGLHQSWKTLSTGRR